MDFTAYFAALSACSPPAPSAALKLTDPGVAEALAEGAGLIVVERGEHHAVAPHRSPQDAHDALESSGPAWGAIDHSGPEAVRAAVADATAPLADDTPGRIAMRAKTGHLVATKP